MFAVTALCVRVSTIKLKSLLKGLKPLIFIILLTGILNLFYTKEGTVLFDWWIFTVTTGGIKRAFLMVVRIMLLICGTLLLTYTTSPIALTDGLEMLLNPLKKIKVPVHEMSMMMSMALRFIPTLIEETDKIMSAQKARGADFSTGKLTERGEGASAASGAALRLQLPPRGRARRRHGEPLLSRRGGPHEDEDACASPGATGWPSWPGRWCSPA